MPLRICHLVLSCLRFFLLGLFNFSFSVVILMMNATFERQSQYNFVFLPIVELYTNLQFCFISFINALFLSAPYFGFLP